MVRQPTFSPVTQVLDSAQIQPSTDDRVSAEQFTSMHASSSTYRDLLIFEERLKYNLIRLKKRQQKYEAFLGILILVIAYCTFATFFQPSQTNYVHVLHKFFLLLSCTTLFLFFATGMYSEKLGYSSKFVPQCNRVLRIFNMHFNRDNRLELSFFRKVPRKFQEGFVAYRTKYMKRRSERRAAAAATSSGKSGSDASSSLGRSTSGSSSRRSGGAPPSLGSGSSGSRRSLLISGTTTTSSAAVSASFSGGNVSGSDSTSSLRRLSPTNASSGQSSLLARTEGGSGYTSRPMVRSSSSSSTSSVSSAVSIGSSTRDGQTTPRSSFGS